jgi:ferredoxin
MGMSGMSGGPKGRGEARAREWWPCRKSSSHACRRGWLVPLAAGGDGNDFYTILNVSPTATKSEIKAGYRALMRRGDLHPDHGATDASTAVMVNLIYDILMDDEHRAEYNVLAGFSGDAGGNPFAMFSVESTRERGTGGEYVFVDEFSCIGCHGCANVDPQTFHIEKEWGRARCASQPMHRGGHGGAEKVSEAMDVCPVSCIHWVNARQYSILEEVMGKMGRVEAFLLMRHQGKGANLSVFVEATLEWARRQSLIRDMEARAKYKGGVFEEFHEWMPHGGAGGGTGGGGPGVGGQGAGRSGRVDRRITQVIDLTRSWRSGTTSSAGGTVDGEPMGLLMSVTEEEEC